MIGLGNASSFNFNSTDYYSEALVPENRISEIIRGRRNITADTALRLSRWFGASPNFWMNLQKRYELRKAEQAHGADIAQIRPRIVASA